MTHRIRFGFTLFQLLVVLAILLILLGLLLPALAKVRASAARMNSMNNLKQLSLAAINYADSNNGNLPPGADDNHFSTVAFLLPYLEQNQVFQQIDFKNSIDAKANAAARRTTIKLFLTPRDPLQAVKPEWGATNYLFNDQVYFLNSKSKFPAFITDGTSQTIMTCETLKGDSGTKATDVKRQYVRLKKEDLKAVGPNTGVKYFQDNKNIAGDRCASWMDGRFLQGTFNGRLRPNDARPDVSCAGLSGVSAVRSLDDVILVAMHDGSVRAVNVKISHQTWKFALTPNAGDILGADW